MTTRKLEEIAANLDDLSVTLEEMNEEIKIKSDATQDTAKLDKVQADMERAADAIEESLTRQPSER